MLIDLASAFSRFVKIAASAFELHRIEFELTDFLLLLLVLPQ